MTCHMAICKFVLELQTVLLLPLTHHFFCLNTVRVSCCAEIIDSFWFSHAVMCELKLEVEWANQRRSEEAVK